MDSLQTRKEEGISEFVKVKRLTNPRSLTGNYFKDLN